MMVTASKTSDYKFYPEYWENIHLQDGVLSTLVLKTDYQTLSIYDEVPQVMIQHAKFNEVEQKRTRNVSSATDFLTELGLCVSLFSNRIVRIQDIKENDYLTINGEDFYFKANHIPQLFYPIGDKRIVAIDGEYDFQFKLFKGVLVLE